MFMRIIEWFLRLIGMGNLVRLNRDVQRIHNTVGQGNYQGASAQAQALNQANQQGAYGAQPFQQQPMVAVQSQAAQNAMVEAAMSNAMAMRGFAWNGATTGPTAPTAAVVASSATAATAADYVLHMAGLDDASPKTRSMLNDYATASGPWGPWRAAALLNLLLLTPEYLAN